jgi:hypothetical protein
MGYRWQCLKSLEGCGGPFWEVRRCEVKAGTRDMAYMCDSS